MENRFKELFFRIDPSREEIYIAILLAVVSAVQIDVFRVVDYPNWVYASTIVVCIFQVYFVLMGDTNKISIWDLRQFWLGLLIDANVLMYAAKYWVQGDSIAAIIFTFTFFISVYCTVQAGRRAWKRHSAMRNRTGKIMWTRVE